MAKKGNFKTAHTFTANFPKRRYEVETEDAKTNYCVKEVDSTIKVKGVNSYAKDFKVYKELTSFNTQMKRHETEGTIVKEGISTLEEAIKIADELAKA